jgi:hypothetical protein
MYTILYNRIASQDASLPLSMIDHEMQCRGSPEYVVTNLGLSCCRCTKTASAIHQTLAHGLWRGAVTAFTPPLSSPALDIANISLTQRKHHRHPTHTLFSTDQTYYPPGSATRSRNHLKRAENKSRMSIENLKTFDPFAEADEDTGQVKQNQQDYIHIRIQRKSILA